MQLKKPTEQYTRLISCRLVQELENLKRQAVSLQRELDEVHTQTASAVSPVSSHMLRLRVTAA